jgi:hypothetical protein
VGDGVTVGDGVGLGVGVSVGVGVIVGVGAGVSVGVGLGIGVSVGIGVGLPPTVGTAVGVPYVTSPSATGPVEIAGCVLMFALVVAFTTSDPLPVGTTQMPVGATALLTGTGVAVPAVGVGVPAPLTVKLVSVENSLQLYSNVTSTGTFVPAGIVVGTAMSQVAWPLTLVDA